MFTPRRFLPRYGPYGQAWRMQQYGKVAKGLTAYGAYKLGQQGYKFSKKSILAKSQVNKQIKQGIRKAKRNTFPKKIKAQIKELKRLSESDMGTHIQRRRFTSRVVSNAAACGNNSFALVNITELEGVLAQLRYYDPSAPSALVQADGTTGTYQKEFNFSKISHIVRLRNNYQVPCRIRMYFCRSKVDTSITALNAFTSGLADVGNPTSTSPLVYLTDSIQFDDLYTILSSKSALLEPGDEVSMSHVDNSFQYDPSLVDSHSLDYQRRYKDLQVFVRVQGVLAHDSSVVTEQTLIPAGVDLELQTTFNVKYSAGADIKYIYIDDESDASFTNGGVVSNKPISDNQAYSVS